MERYWFFSLIAGLEFDNNWCCGRNPSHPILSGNIRIICACTRIGRRKSSLCRFRGRVRSGFGPRSCSISALNPQTHLPPTPFIGLSLFIKFPQASEYFRTCLKSESRNISVILYSIIVFSFPVRFPDRETHPTNLSRKVLIAFFPFLPPFNFLVKCLPSEFPGKKRYKTKTCLKYRTFAGAKTFAR